MYRIVKRFLDLFIAAASGAVLLPFLLLIVIAIRIDSKGPILFRQIRFGKNNSRFEILKFRTMYADSPPHQPTHTLRAPEQWITPVGRFLRRTSLDELPQLYNILVGDMSIIGPRPALWNQQDLIAAREQYVGRWGLTPNGLRPGLTGWAQINGRDEIDIVQKAWLDGEYAARISLLFDLKCFFGTFKSVATSEGVSEGGPGRRSE